MSVKFYENALTALKKANTARKMVLAGRAGYDTVEAYQSFLEAMAVPGETQAPKESIVEAVKKVKPPVKKPVVYVVDVVDCSSSMSGGKIENANKGVNQGVEELKKEDKVTYMHFACSFSYKANVKVTAPLAINDVKEFKFKADGYTALNDAIVKTLKAIKEVKNPSDKALVNIYTDGGENDSVATVQAAREAIKMAEKEGVTVTFIGTKYDTRNAITKFEIDESNTMTYDGSALGLQQTMSATVSARSNYSAKLSKGEDVSKGFFKDIN